MSKRGLGRGLDDLLGDFGRDVLDEPEFERLKQIEVSRIEPGKYQPRRRFDEEALNELALSIAEHGILQPLVVRPIGGDSYEIIAGERRFRAGQQAGLSSVPCVIKNYSDKEALAVALIENLQRSDLNALEVAEGLQQLVNDFSLTHDRVAQLVGRSRSSVTNSLRLLDLSPVVKKALLDNDIEMGHGRAMLSLSLMQQNEMLDIILKQHLSVRETERYVKKILSGEPPVEKPIRDSDIEALEQRLADFIGIAVNISHKKKGHGKLVLKYKNLEQFEDILKKLGFER